MSYFKEEITDIDSTQEDENVSYDENKIHIQRPIITELTPHLKSIRKVSVWYNVFVFGIIAVVMWVFFLPSMGIRFSDWSTFSLYKKIGILCFTISITIIILLSVVRNLLPSNQKFNTIFWDDLLITSSSITINNIEWEEPKRIPSVDVKQIVLAQDEFITKKQEKMFRTLFQIITTSNERIDLRIIYSSEDLEVNQEFFDHTFRFFEMNFNITPRTKTPIQKITYIGLFFGLGIIAGLILIFIF